MYPVLNVDGAPAGRGGSISLRASTSSGGIVRRPFFTTYLLTLLAYTFPRNLVFLSSSLRLPPLRLPPLSPFPTQPLLLDPFLGWRMYFLGRNAPSSTKCDTTYNHFRSQDKTRVQISKRV